VKKNKFNIVLNIAGLWLSITSSLFIFLYLHDELNYDRFHKEASNIYRISLTLKFNDLDLYVPMASPPLGMAMSKQIPEVRESLRLYGIDKNHVIRYQTKSFTEKKVLYADANFFSFFDFVLIKGDKKTALQEPNSIVITSELANKYFGKEDPIGKLIMVDGVTFSVTGIAASAPTNSHIVFDALMSMSSNKISFSTSWMGNQFLTYVKIFSVADPKEVDKKLDNLVLQNIGPDLENSLGVSLGEFLKQKNKIGYDLHPLVQTHLYSKFPRDITPAGDVMYVYLFIAIGISLLLMGCFNFMNLSTAQFTDHIRRNSIQKILGASRVQLVTDFIKHTFRLCIGAALISWLSFYLLIPAFNGLSGKSFHPDVTWSLPVLIYLTTVTVLISILSASYPALYLSSFNPADGLRQMVPTGGSEKARQWLVTVQFVLSIITVTFTMVILFQLEFISQRNLGFNKDKIITLGNIDRLGANSVPLKNALLNENGIEAVSFSDRLLFERMSGEAVRVPSNPQSHIVNFYVSDEDQLKVMGFKLVSGRFFSKDFKSDSNAVVINEAAMRDLGWKNFEERDLAADADIRYKVVGVIGDFNFESLRREVKPLMIFHSPLPGNTLNIRYGNVEPTALIELLRKNWKQYGNDEPFEYSFLNQDFDKLFKTETKVGKLLTLFCGTVIGITVIGLFALSRFAAQKRTREIGIRKVLGASVKNIIGLLSRQLTKLFYLALACALAPSYIVSKWWLESFAYHQENIIGPFLIATTSIAIIAAITFAYHSLRAASLDPVKTLRTD
jgi:putative ABC transport system permease protein